VTPDVVIYELEVGKRFSYVRLGTISDAAFNIGWDGSAVVPVRDGGDGRDPVAVVDPTFLGQTFTCWDGTRGLATSGVWLLWSAARWILTNDTASHPTPNAGRSESPARDFYEPFVS